LFEPITVYPLMIPVCNLSRDIVLVTNLTDKRVVLTKRKQIKWFTVNVKLEKVKIQPDMLDIFLTILTLYKILVQILIRGK
jgi:hypothetical protein